MPVSGVEWSVTLRTDLSKLSAGERESLGPEMYDRFCHKQAFSPQLELSDKTLKAMFSSIT